MKLAPARSFDDLATMSLVASVRLLLAAVDRLRGEYTAPVVASWIVPLAVVAACLVVRRKGTSARRTSYLVTCAQFLLLAASLFLLVIAHTHALSRGMYDQYYAVGELSSVMFFAAGVCAASCALFKADEAHRAESARVPHLSLRVIAIPWLVGGLISSPGLFVLCCGAIVWRTASAASGQSVDTRSDVLFASAVVVLLGSHMYFVFLSTVWSNGLDACAGWADAMSRAMPSLGQVNQLCVLLVIAGFVVVIREERPGKSLTIRRLTLPATAIYALAMGYSATWLVEDELAGRAALCLAEARSAACRFECDRSPELLE